MLLQQYKLMHWDNYRLVWILGVHGFASVFTIYMMLSMEFSSHIYNMGIIILPVANAHLMVNSCLLC